MKIFSLPATKRHRPKDDAITFLLTYTLLFILTSFPALAMTPYEQDFAAMEADPANPEKSFRFVQTAVKSNDLNGAIAALERILLHNPGLANIQLELGVLYLRAGAAELASDNINQALRSPEVPSWVRARARNLLSQANRTSSRHTFSGSLFLAGKHDSNANAAPSSRLVRIRGIDGLLDEDDTGQADISTEFSARFKHNFDLNTQAGHQLETSFSTYNRIYDKSSDIDVNSLDLKTGPRFYFGPVLNPSWSLRPFALASQLYLDGDKYLRSAGLGVNSRKSFSTRLLAELELSGEDQRYDNSTLRPNASERSGKFYALRSNASYVFSPALQLTTQLGFNTRNANEDYESLSRSSLRISTTYSYKAPFKLSSNRWRLTLSSSIQRAEYDAADPLIDPNVKRKDTRTDISLSNSFSLGKRGSLVLATQYTDNDSSLPNFDYNNWNGSLGWAYHF